MDAKVDEKGNVTFNLLDAFENLDGDIQEELIANLAWSTPIWKEIERGVREELAGENYNDTIYRLRLAFLKDESVDKNIRDLIEELLTSVKKYSKDASDYNALYWKWYHWYQDMRRRGIFEEPVPFDTPKYEYTRATPSDVEVLLKQMGITKEMLENPLQEKRDA